jgi:hypothetical protein
MWRRRAGWGSGFRLLGFGLRGFGPLGWMVASAAALCAGTLPASAVPVVLEDGVATVSIDPATGGGVTAWTVNGAAHVREQGFYWRVGSAGGEAPLSALVLDSVLASDLDGDGVRDTLALGWSDAAGRFDLETRWTLSGSDFAGPAAGATSTLLADVTVVNNTAGVLDFSLFQYTDADLFGSFADDSASFAAANGGAVQDGSGLATWQADWGVSPDAFEASLYSALLASLGDGAPTALSGALAAGPGDVTVGVGWHVLLGAGEGFSRSQIQTISVAPIPEPSVALLVGAGLFALAAGQRGISGGKRS